MNTVIRSRPRVKTHPRHNRIANLAVKTRPLLSAHWKYGGDGFIAGEGEGIVTVGGEPASRRIYLFARPTMELVDAQWSRGDGTYRFARLNTETQYMMIAADHKKQYEPVGYDYITPVTGQP